MRTVYVEIPSCLTGEELEKVVRRHRSRTGAFYAELQEVADHQGRLRPAVAFYVTEELRRPTPLMRRRMLERIVPSRKASVPSGEDGEMSGGEAILYGERGGSDGEVRSWLELHRLSPVGAFYDEDAGREGCSYPFLQKALFFAGRRRIPLVITRSGRLMEDIRLLNLLSDSRVRFHCVDFPWFNHANLELFRALALYRQE